MIISDEQRIEMLSPAEIELIHRGACRLLSQTGVKVTHEDIAARLLAGGARREGERIFVSPGMIEDALEKTAKTIQFDAPDPAYSFTLNAAENMVKFGPGGQALYIVEPIAGGWDRRAAGTDDLKKILALCDQLEQVNFTTRPVECDVPEEQMDVEKAGIFRRYCSKPMNLANLIMVEHLDEVLGIVGDPAYVSFIISLISSPLVLDSFSGDKFIALLEKDLPVSISCCPQGGSTAPFSEVGELLQLHAELLFGFVLANIIRPGAKVLYRGIPITSNLYTDGSPRWCQPESIRRVALAGQLCRFYGLPCCGTAGVSDETEPSAQGIAEKVLSWVYGTASGAQYINSALGMLEQVLSVSYYQYVIDDIALKAIKEKFAENSMQKTSALAMDATVTVLNKFGVAVDEKMEAELASRIRHIESALEPYGEDYIDEQIAIVEKAVNKSSSTVFMVAARKGLREGYLYRGDRIDAPLDLSGVTERLEASGISGISKII